MELGKGKSEIKLISEYHIVITIYRYNKQTKGNNIMSTGYGSASATIIDEDLLKKVCPKKLKVFLDLVEASEEYEIDSEFFASELSCGDLAQDDDNGGEAIDEAYVSLCNAFEKATKLTLEFEVHDSDNSGDAHDDVDGHFWSVGNVYQPTQEALAFIKKYGADTIQEVSYVQFG